jgi:hypothetical protein
MSLMVESVSSRFLIKSKDIPECFKAIRAAGIPATDIIDAFERNHFSVSVDEQRNICSIHMEWHRVGEVWCEEFLSTIAPYVKNGSFIEVEGSDSGRPYAVYWKYVFRRKILMWQQSKLVYMKAVPVIHSR